MASRLSIEEEKLKVGQVERIVSDGGKTINYIKLLLNDNAEVLFAPKGNILEFTISNPNIDMSNLDCFINEETLRDFVVAIKDVYNQIISNKREENI